MDNGEALKALRDGTRERLGKLLAAIAHENTPAAAAIRVMATELGTLADLLYSVVENVPSKAEDPADVAELRAQIYAIGRALGEHLVSTRTNEQSPAQRVPSGTEQQPPELSAEQQQPPQDAPSDQRQDGTPQQDDGTQASGAPPI